MSTELALVWQRREPPLPPLGVVARGGVVPGLASATARHLAAGHELKVCHADGWLVVLGDSSHLPWVDGVVYVGLEDGLYVPTLSTCTPPPDVVRRALRPEPGPTREVIVLVGNDVLFSPAPVRVPDVSSLAALR